MADTEAIKQAIVQALVEAAKAMVLVINKEDKRQGIHIEHNGTSDATRHRTGPPGAASLPLEHKYKYVELKNFEMDLTNIFATRYFYINDVEKSFHDKELARKVYKNFAAEQELCKM